MSEELTEEEMQEVIDMTEFVPPALLELWNNASPQTRLKATREIKQMEQDMLREIDEAR